MLVRMVVSMSMSNALNTVIWPIAITIRLIVIITAAELLIPHIRINTCDDEKK